MDALVTLLLSPPITRSRAAGGGLSSRLPKCLRPAVAGHGRENYYCVEKTLFIDLLAVDVIEMKPPRKPECKNNPAGMQTNAHNDRSIAQSGTVVEYDWFKR